MQDKKAAIAATTGPSGSWLQLFNPISQLTGGNDRYPELVASMFPGNPKAAWMVSKIGAIGLLAAALSGGARALQHVARVNDISKRDDPARKLKSEISTTFELPLGAQDGGQRKTASDAPKQSLDMPSPIDIAGNTINTLVPVSALLLAAAAAYKGMDHLANSRRNKLLSQAIANKSNAVRQLMHTRARLAKGTASDEDVERALEAATANHNYVKTAKDEHPYARAGLTSLGLLLVALGVASAAGAYRYASVSDADNIKYKALKAGLGEYSRAKTQRAPITTLPQDASEYFGSIDAPGGEESARALPEVQQPNTPISVSL